MITYQNSQGDLSGTHCMRIGNKNAGIQLCAGTFSGSRPCSVALNGSTTVYTGVAKNTDDPATFSSFPLAFSTPPLAVASPAPGNCWFSDVLANASGLSRLDFYAGKKYTSDAPLAFGGNFLAIGQYGNTEQGALAAALSSNDIHAYLDEKSSIVRILRTDKAPTYSLQIASGSFSGSISSSSQVNSIHHATIVPGTGSFAFPFSNTPAIVAAPSMQCRDWSDQNKFSHPYWFGGINATAVAVSKLDVYSNASLAKQSVYGRYIAIGLASTDVKAWKEVPISLTRDEETGTYVLRFGDTSSGLQLAFGEVSFNDRKIQKQLNKDVSGATNIFTAFKKAPAYQSTEPMYFPQAFCKSPSVIMMTAEACRKKVGNTTTFPHPYWFGDAAADAVSMFNADFYTNKQFTTNQEVHAKYLAAGPYNSSADKAAPLIREALSYLDNEPINGLVWYDNTPLDSLPISKGILAEYTINRHKEDSNSKDQIEFSQLSPSYTDISDWCSEFASVVADHVLGIDSTNSSFPRQPSFHKFKVALNEKSEYSSTPSDELDEAKASNDVPVPLKVGDLLFTRGQSKNATTGKYNGHTCMVINANGNYVFTVEGNRRNPDAASGTINNIVKRERRKIKGANPDNGKDTIWGIGSIKWE